MILDLILKIDINDTDIWEEETIEEAIKGEIRLAVMGEARKLAKEALSRSKNRLLLETYISGLMDKCERDLGKIISEFGGDVIEA